MYAWFMALDEEMNGNFTFFLEEFDGVTAMQAIGWCDGESCGNYSIQLIKTEQQHQQTVSSVNSLRNPHLFWGMK